MDPMFLLNSVKDNQVSVTERTVLELFSI